jgi:hypothetical protein
LKMYAKDTGKSMGGYRETINLVII